MTRSSKDVGAAWGRLIGMAVDACKSHHAAHAAKPAHTTDQKPHGPFVHSRRKHGETPDPNNEETTITLTAHQRCRPTWTGQRGVVTLTFDQQTQMHFDHSPVHLLPAGENLTSAVQTATPNPMQLTGPGSIEVSIDAQLPRGLYLGNLVQASTNNLQPLLIYIDDLI